MLWFNHQPGLAQVGVVYILWTSCFEFVPHLQRTESSPPAAASSAYHAGLHLLKLVDEGKVPVGYMTIANGSFCVVVHGTELLVLIAAYFEWNTLPVPLSPAAYAMLPYVALFGLRTLIEAQVCSVHSKVISFVYSSCCLLSGCITLGRTPATLDPAVSTIVFPAV